MRLLARHRAQVHALVTKGQRVEALGKHAVFVRCGGALGMRRCARIIGHGGPCTTKPLDGAVLPMGIVPSLSNPQK